MIRKLFRYPKFGKLLDTRVSSMMIEEKKIVSKYLGFTLIPQGGVALNMAILAKVRFLQVATETGVSDFEVIGTTIFTVILGAIIFYKIIGEIVVNWLSKNLRN